jgi:hypothetical protein
MLQQPDPDCRTLHAHLVVWLDSSLSAEEKERVFAEIVACVPAQPNPECQHTDCTKHDFWQRPECPWQAELFDMVMRKMFHTCATAGAKGGCREKGPCRYGFPYDAQPLRFPQVRRRDHGAGVQAEQLVRVCHIRAGRGAVWPYPVLPARA